MEMSSASCGNDAASYAFGLNFAIVAGEFQIHFATMKGSCFFAMLGGMVLGSVITLLATPKSGAEVRGQIKDLVNREARKVRDKYHEVEGKVEEAAAKK